MSKNAEHQRKWRLEHPEEFRAYQREYKAANKERLAEYQRLYRPKNTAKRRENRVMREYGLTLDQVAEIRAGQGDLCPCGGLLQEDNIDHCHNCGEVGGIMHNNCNLALGMAGDLPARLRKLADYLEAHQCR